MKYLFNKSHGSKSKSKKGPKGSIGVEVTLNMSKQAGCYIISLTDWLETEGRQQELRPNRQLQPLPVE